VGESAELIPKKQGAVLTGEENGACLALVVYCLRVASDRLFGIHIQQDKMRKM
jgi:hypothetical protein